MIWVYIYIYSKSKWDNRRITHYSLKDANHWKLWISEAKCLDVSSDLTTFCWNGWPLEFLTWEAGSWTILNRTLHKRGILRKNGNTARDGNRTAKWEDICQQMRGSKADRMLGWWFLRWRGYYYHDMIVGSPVKQPVKGANCSEDVCWLWLLKFGCLLGKWTCTPQPGRCSRPNMAHQLILIRDSNPASPLANMLIKVVTST